MTNHIQKHLNSNKAKKEKRKIIENTKIMTITRAELNEELFKEIHNKKTITIEKQDFSKIKKLVKAGADVNAFDEQWYNQTPLMIASMEGNIELVKLLLELGADVNKSKKKYDNVLYNLFLELENDCYPEHYEIVNELIKHKINLNIKDEQGRTPLMIDVMNGGMFIKQLIKSGADVNVIDNENNYILYYAISNNSMESVIKLINAGIKIDERSLLMPHNKEKNKILKILKNSTS